MDNDDNERILRKIEDMQEERGWTKYRLAKESKIKSSTLTTMFSRRATISVENITRICRAFGISRGAFWTSVDGGDNRMIEEEQFVEFWRNLTDRERRLLAAFMKSLPSER